MILQQWIAHYPRRVPLCCPGYKYELSRPFCKTSSLDRYTCHIYTIMCRQIYHRCKARKSPACVYEFEEFIFCDQVMHAPPSELRACRGRERHLWFDVPACNECQAFEAAEAAEGESSASSFRDEATARTSSAAAALTAKPRVGKGEQGESKPQGVARAAKSVLSRCRSLRSKRDG